MTDSILYLYWVRATFFLQRCYCRGFTTNTEISFFIKGCRVRLYGSSLTGFGLKNCNINLDLQLGGPEQKPHLALLRALEILRVSVLFRYMAPYHQYCTRSGSHVSCLFAWSATRLKDRSVHRRLIGMTKSSKCLIWILNQCGGSGMFNPDPTFFHPGSEPSPSRIPDPHQRI